MCVKRSQYFMLLSVNFYHPFTYPLLTEFEGRTVNYVRVFPHRFLAKARSARAINRRVKTSVRNLQNGQRNEVNEIFIISLYFEIERAKTKF